MAKRKKSTSTSRRKTKKKSRKTSSRKRTKKPKLPSRIFAQVSPHSVGGLSMFSGQDRITCDTIANFESEESMIHRCVDKLREAKFDVLYVTSTTINIAGTAKQYEDAFGADLVAEERATIKSQQEETTATYIDCTDTELSGLIVPRTGAFSNLIEGIAIEEPRYLDAASRYAPLEDYWHLRLPGDVSLGCNADRAHRGNITGRDIKVAMVDSGFFAHPFFEARGYRVAHGTWPRHDPS